MGTLNAIVLCYLGIHAGRILIYYEKSVARLVRFLIIGPSFFFFVLNELRRAGVVMCALSLLCCEVSTNEGNSRVMCLFQVSLIIRLDSTECKSHLHFFHLHGRRFRLHHFCRIFFPSSIQKRTKRKVEEY